MSKTLILYIRVLLRRASQLKPNTYAVLQPLNDGRFLLQFVTLNPGTCNRGIVEEKVHYAWEIYAFINHFKENYIKN